MVALDKTWKEIVDASLAVLKDGNPYTEQVSTTLDYIAIRNGSYVVQSGRKTFVTESENGYPVFMDDPSSDIPSE